MKLTLYIQNKKQSENNIESVYFVRAPENISVNINLTRKFFYKNMAKFEIQGLLLKIINKKLKPIQKKL